MRHHGDGREANDLESCTFVMRNKVAESGEYGNLRMVSVGETPWDEAGGTGRKLSVARKRVVQTWLDCEL